MCGIIIAKDAETFKTLCRLNESRGNYSFGGLFLFGENFYIQRKVGVVGAIPEDADTYLGHNRAPTSNVFEFDPLQSHPFQHGDWVVGHNGIIRNFVEAQEHYKTDFKVDSNIIPFILEYIDKQVYNNPKDKVTVLKDAFEELIGTFGCWIYNKVNKQVYVFRSTNSLFYSSTAGAISSAEFQGSKMIKDNTLCRYSHQGLEELLSLDSAESPFYIPD